MSESLLEFPCDFPLKIMGKKHDQLVPAVLAIVQMHAPDFEAAHMTLRQSTQGNYLGLTCTLRATSQAQLDAIYRALTSHPLVKVVL